MLRETLFVNYQGKVTKSCMGRTKFRPWRRSKFGQLSRLDEFLLDQAQEAQGVEDLVDSLLAN